MRNALSKKIVDIQPSGIRKFFDVVSEIPDAISLGVGEPGMSWKVWLRAQVLICVRTRFRMNLIHQS